MKLIVDKLELLAAFETNSMESLYYLNLKTGSFKVVFSNESFFEDDFDDINNMGIDRIMDVDAEFGLDLWQQVPLEESWESYNRMVTFVDSVQHPKLKQLLSDAINRRKPFKNFKDILFNYPPEREDWFAFESTQKEEKALSWLKELESKFNLTIQLK